MFKYRNVQHGRVIERPAADEWLEASAGWERLDDDGPEAFSGTLLDGLDDDDLAADAAEDNERTDD